MDSSQSSYRFVRVDEFTPNSGKPWTSFGPVATVVRDTGNPNLFTLTGIAFGPGLTAPVLQITVLGPASFRVRFNPRATSPGDYVQDGSYAVVNKDLGPISLKVLSQDGSLLSLSLGPDFRLDVALQPFAVLVYHKGRLISSDTEQGVVYLPGVLGAEATANFKSYPANANYFGFGEKGGNTLSLNQNSMTFFNYDNFKYGGSAHPDGSAYLPVVPPFSQPGPLNTAEPLYNSIPFLIEDNPNPLDGNGLPTGSPYAYGIFLDNESQSYFNMGQSSSYAGNMYGKYYFGALYGELDYYFMAGPDTAAVLDQYTTLTGRVALAPMWALGYHQGCYGYFSQEKVLTAVQNYRAAKIPLDGIHIDVDFQDNYRTFTASPKKFPNGGKDTFDALRLLGVKASTNITGIISMVPQDETGKTAPYSVLDDGLKLGVFYENVRVDAPPPAAPLPLVVNENYGVDVGGFNPYQPPGSTLSTYGHYADLGRLEVREWWGTLYKPLLDAGLEMVWQDMTDPATQGSTDDTMPWKTLPLNMEVYDYTTDSMVAHAQVHNVFALNLVSATHTGLVKLRKESGVDKRPFIVTRGGYAGVHRYAASWTGDSASDWDFLAVLIPEILNFGLSGQPMAGADVGGFATSGTGGPQNGTGPFNVTTPELLVRWTTLSAFIGWFRNHYDGYNKSFQEPYKYGVEVADICRNYIEIRYKLLQYFYDALYECTQTGLPICRPLFLTDRTDPKVYGHLDDQFLVGNDILVSPVVKPGQTQRDVYLPAGSDWFVYTDNKAPLSGPTPGGQAYSWWVPLNLVPVYIRAGAIIPHRELEQYVGELPINPLTFDIYPGPTRTHKLFLDDKIGTGAVDAKKYRYTEITQSETVAVQRVRTVTVDRKIDNFQPAEPYYFVAFLQSTPPQGVTVNGAPVSVLAAGSDGATADALTASTVDAAYYNASLQTTFVKVFDTVTTAVIVGSF